MNKWVAVTIDVLLILAGLVSAGFGAYYFYAESWFGLIPNVAGVVAAVIGGLFLKLDLERK